MKIKSFLLVGVLASVPLFSFHSNDRAAFAADAYLSPEEAGLDYELQGEYVGTVDAWGGQYAAQVIAMGDGKLEVNLLPSGLPGDGYKKNAPKKILIASLTEEEHAKGIDIDFHLTIANEQMVITNKSGEEAIGTLTKVVRESPTLGAEPPEGAIVLFDGSNTDAFLDGTLRDGKYLGVGTESIEHFGDHTMHIEFRTPFMPKSRGQARGNSGVYVQGRYEIQVLDSFGLTGEDNECGGIYQIARPKLNMCFPPLSWQTFDIDFRAARYDESGTKTENARITIKHNGVLIHDNVELLLHTPGKNQESPSDGPIYLQDHGDPVVFQNIWVVKK